MRIMFHLCPASKAAVRQEKYPAHVWGRNGVTGAFFLQADGLHYINGTERGCSCYETKARTTGQDGRGGFFYKPVACITWAGRQWYCEKCGEIVLECCGCGIFALSLP